MVRVVVKGGVWKNTEDEILKAAISKYGKNQWARISSLLVRKTPKQCKARWYEWLDPSIKKTEWSKEEDEKLLHLAKLMPTQWRTIAPIVGRTATQCLERYQKLLDEAEARENEEAGPSSLGLTGPDGGESAPSAEDVRKLRPGEIDPDPETKPARPDPVDMDEDEKEMLSEARARLANTQGKKAKRKARERALEEARRLAMLQKRRELKAAGIFTKPKPKKKGMDYNADIPFEKAPMAGFYDTSEEASRSTKAPVGQTLRQLDGKRPHDEEEKRRKQQEQKKESQSKNGKDPFAGARDEQLRKLREAEQISKRRKLNLPEAQVGERELEDIVKLGQAGETTRKMVEDGGNEASQGLLGDDYSALDRAKHARTPRTAPQEDTVMREARNLRNMQAQQTPLLGDANATLLEGTGSATALPSTRGPSQTPNPLLTPAHGPRAEDPGATPLASVRGRGPSDTPRTEMGGPSATPIRTPLRDNLGLNASDDGYSVMGDATPRDAKRAELMAKRQLQMGLRGLPAPKNDFDIVLDGEDQDEQPPSAPQLSEEDAAERDARLAKLEEEKRQKDLARRTQVVKLGLPRPVLAVNVPSLLAQLDKSFSDTQDTAVKLVREEMVKLMHYDAIVHPLAGSNVMGGSQTNILGKAIPDEKLDAAKEAIRVEMGTALGYPGANAEALKRLVKSHLSEDDDDDEKGDGVKELESFEQVLRTSRDALAWDASSKTWKDAEQMSAKEIVQGKVAQLEHVKSLLTSQAQACAKDEKRLAKILGGYQARGKALGDQIRELFTKLESGAIELQTFERLEQGEEVGAEKRMGSLGEEVGHLERMQRMAQGTFRELEERRRLLRDQVAQLEQEVAMRHAERINDAALAMEED